jgi:hypothetical protein
MGRTIKPPVIRSRGSTPRPLLFAPPLATARMPRSPRCPGIYVLGPEPERPTLTDLIAALVEGHAETDLTVNAASDRR